MRYLIHHRDFQILLIIDSPLVFFQTRCLACCHTEHICCCSAIWKKLKIASSALQTKNPLQMPTVPQSQEGYLAICPCAWVVIMFTMWNRWSNAWWLFAASSRLFSCSPCCFCAIMPGSVASVLMREKIGKTRTNFDEIYLIIPFSKVLISV